jgi:hypothetical protein
MRMVVAVLLFPLLRQWRVVDSLVWALRAPALRLEEAPLDQKAPSVNTVLQRRLLHIASVGFVRRAPAMGTSGVPARATTLKNALTFGAATSPQPWGSDVEIDWGHSGRMSGGMRSLTVTELETKST